ncbi:RNA-binding domain-containing protein [Pseudomonas anguilliseptica]|uniref:RNA-binding domain-containing protein n=1 Tax=Pseudomonas anguilliseptica TaxID=53406 RepID=UPI001F291410|nr:RNA-binding domain-containing protein [Pseudomonas anguilliseptica]MCE5364348.1 putative DNA binding domain-containing protein [Pseudomonas anguilliseptica]
MIDLHSPSDLELLRESIDLECKLAAGRDGQGALPEDFWLTYSAFANTQGGVVLLGVREKKGQFQVEGIVNPAKVRKELFDNLNNRKQVSANLLSDGNVREVELGGRTLLLVDVPRANRKQRPVYLTTNPFGHTYRRLNDGDRHVSDEDVKRMLAEQVEDSRDDRILKGYHLDDLCGETLRAYRQVFANRDPVHPWNTLEDQEFLRQIGGWRRDRENDTAGLTLAGLLMFGWMSTIQEALPNYMLDYQERPEARTELRWVDRVTLDGKWSGNLFDFYRKVYLKLTADLKVPFKLEKGERQDETPVHVALREALANVLVHADYSDRASVLVVKRPDMFGFRNPGLMRVPPEVAIRGGEHDCRNRTLHKMFRFVGVGEQAGSGIPKIYAGWKDRHWRTPALFERAEPYNQTLLELRMVDLLPAEVLAALRLQFGMAFDQLSHDERLTLAAAASERTVSHARIMEMTGIQSLEASRLLQGLVRTGFLESHNPGRGAVYCLPGAGLPTPEDVFGGGSEYLSESSEYLTDSSGHLLVSSGHLAGSSGHLLVSSGHLPESGDKSCQRDSQGRRLTEKLDAPLIDDLALLNEDFRRALVESALLARAYRKLDADEMQRAIVDVCHGHYITGTCLAELLSRNADSLRKQHLKQLVQTGRLQLAFPTTPTHQMQAYRTTESE